LSATASTGLQARALVDAVPGLGLAERGVDSCKGLGPGDAKLDLVLNNRRRKATRPATARRAKPQDFRVAPRRPFPWMTVIFLLIAAGGAVGWYFLSAARPHGYDLVLKSTDKAVASKTWSGETILDEGGPVPIGSTLETRNSQKTVFRYGPGGSLRAAAHTQFTLTDSETEPKGKNKEAFATIDLAQGRLWLLSGPDTSWIVRSPVAIVRPQGRVTEVKVAENGTCTVTVWQGKAELSPIKHPDRAVVVGEKQEASFGPDLTLVNPHPLTLVKDDPWLAWNLLETMGKEINEKPAAAASSRSQK
jgi:hypothetical protein